MEVVGFVASIGTIAGLGKVIIKTAKVLLSVATDNGEIANQIRCAGGLLDTGGVAIEVAYRALQDHKDRIDKSSTYQHLAKSNTFNTINGIVKYLFQRIEDSSLVERRSLGQLTFRKTLKWVLKDKAIFDDILLNIKELETTLQIILAVVQLELNNHLARTANEELRQYIAEQQMFLRERLRAVERELRNLTKHVSIQGIDPDSGSSSNGVSSGLRSVLSLSRSVRTKNHVETRSSDRSPINVFPAQSSSASYNGVVDTILPNHDDGSIPPLQVVRWRPVEHSNQARRPRPQAATQLETPRSSDARPRVRQPSPTVAPGPQKSELSSIRGNGGSEFWRVSSGSSTLTVNLLESKAVSLDYRRSGHVETLPVPGKVDVECDQSLMSLRRAQELGIGVIETVEGEPTKVLISDSRTGNPISVLGKTEPLLMGRKAHRLLKIQFFICDTGQFDVVLGKPFVEREAHVSRTGKRKA
jgi:hypothetical protein